MKNKIKMCVGITTCPEGRGARGEIKIRVKNEITEGTFNRKEELHLARSGSLEVGGHIGLDHTAAEVIGDIHDRAGDGRRGAGRRRDAKRNAGCCG